jgi:hypothetical protein
MRLRRAGHGGGGDLDAARKRVPEVNNVHLSLCLDDPSFGNAIHAALVVIDGVHSLVWSRSNGHKEDQGGQPAPPIRRGGRGARLPAPRVSALKVAVATNRSIRPP